ncbi:hypothetical protein FO454_01075 [Staphylococcus lugdunensis]|uniref:Uncharacterized protein n=1 Tax=Staphylococcus lugdunensis TaxID=28035 RepID=A0ABX6BY09_STALU|nr:hypothetical protein B7454_03120 [Staphylococcus lugdunensis]QEX27739.1 hypothetical protein FO459_11105 [Staphylococcus lugdunensis]QEX32496.1 hypothetical protein FO457_01575 [Staphylococcus lugdunensis]QEX37362.1 hypothetical protein FO455_10890 [Staphylococcus lugdunensis]QEX39801.1 hypothetical protein FO454_01075 [Staphylococcus lugdunensis]
MPQKTRLRRKKQNDQIGANKENFEKKFTRQSKLGWGPNKKKCDKHFREQRKLGWAPTKRNVSSISKRYYF